MKSKNRYCFIIRMEDARMLVEVKEYRRQRVGGEVIARLGLHEFSAHNNVAGSRG